MTNIPKHDGDDSDDIHDGLTFEVIEEEDTNEGQKVKRRGIYLWPNLITTAALLSGFYSIVASMDGHYLHAIYAIFIAALLDGLDGRVARAIGAQSPFGEQFDSLSDLIAFGVAPAILMYSWDLHELGRIGLACCFVYTACGAFRLARFNVQIGIVDKRYFIGIASPLAAILVICLVWVSKDYPEIFVLKSLGVQVFYSVVMVIVGLLMISNMKYYSFKQMDKKRVPFIVMLPVVLVLAAITYNIPMGILTVCTLYVLSGFITTLAARKNK